VFIGGKFIGGGDETAALDKKNQLRPMISKITRKSYKLIFK